MLQFKRPLLASLLAGILFALTFAPLAQADSNVGSKPSELAVIGDIAIARPILIVMTGAGLAVNAAILPFSILGGNESEMADILVNTPARSAFLRCVGCTPAQDQSRRISNQVNEANESTSSDKANQTDNKEK